MERARAAAHWRSVGSVGPGAPLDPQRAPQPADVAELLRPAAGPAAALLLVQALRLAKVPLLPCSGYALAPADGARQALGDALEADGGELLLALVRAARRLPRHHPARPQPAQAAPLVALVLDPPHYFTNDAGDYLLDDFVCNGSYLRCPTWGCRVIYEMKYGLRGTMEIELAYVLLWAGYVSSFYAFDF